MGTDLSQSTSFVSETERAAKIKMPTWCGRWRCNRRHNSRQRWACRSLCALSRFGLRKVNGDFLPIFIFLDVMQRLIVGSRIDTFLESRLFPGCRYLRCILVGHSSRSITLNAPNYLCPNLLCLHTLCATLALLLTQLFLQGSKMGFKI